MKNKRGEEYFEGAREEAEKQRGRRRPGEERKAVQKSCKSVIVKIYWVALFVYQDYCSVVALLWYFTLKQIFVE